jgi:hypothetical protein
MREKSTSAPANLRRSARASEKTITQNAGHAVGVTMERTEVRRAPGHPPRDREARRQLVTTPATTGKTRTPASTCRDPGHRTMRRSADASRLAVGATPRTLSSFMTR